MVGAGMTEKGDDYEEIVKRPNGGEVGQCHIREEMPAKKGDIWRGGLALGRE